MKLTLLFITLLSALWLGSCKGSTGKSTEVSQSGLVATGTETGGEPASESGKPIHLTKAEFLTKVYDYEKNPNDWVYNGDKPCIIDFYADWCRPCKMVAPILDELAQKYDGKLVIYKINTDEERELASYFGIQSIPTILFCPVSGKPQMTQGALPKETFEKVVSEVLIKQ